MRRSNAAPDFAKPEEPPTETGTETGKETTTPPTTEWMGRSHLIQMDTEGEVLREADKELIGSTKDVKRVLSLLEQENNFRLHESHKDWVHHTKETIDESAFAEWNEYNQFGYSDSEGERKEQDNHRLEILTKNRHKCVSFLIALTFHTVIVLDFTFCVWKSYEIILEDAKFQKLYLDGTFNCLEMLPSHDVIAHVVNIFDAFSSVTALYATSAKSANLCWLFVIGAAVHACFEVYTFLFIMRFFGPGGLKATHMYKEIIKFASVFAGQIISTLVMMQRYYDLTGGGHKRAHKFITQTHEGKQLNDRIMYRNVSSFMQRKYVLRSCTALQIYDTVQKLQLAKSKLKKGEELDEALFQQHAKQAVLALKDVQHFKGMDMLKELKRRHYEHVREQFELGEETERRNEATEEDERIEEILEEPKGK